MKFLKKFVPLLLILVTLAPMLLLKSVSSRHLWNGYTVLYVSDKVSDLVVRDSLDFAKINDYVSLSDQKQPVLLKENSPEMSMLRIFGQSEEYKYMYRRLNYFYDQSKEYRIYYIPDQYKNNLSSCIKFLEHRGIAAGIDAETVYPWILPVIIVILILFLTIFSKSKILFFMGAVVPGVYVFTNPYFSSVTAVILLLLNLFFFSNIWNRKSSIRNLTRNFTVILLIAAALVSSFAASVKAGLLFIAALAGCFLSVYLYIQIHRDREARRQFQFVFIRPAKMISIFAGKMNLVMPVLLAGIAGVIIYFVLTFSGTVNVADTKIKLPGKSAEVCDELPDLEEFYRWNWNVNTAPYRNLNVNNDNPDVILFPKYIENEDKTIVQKNFIIQYDDSYKLQIQNSIDTLGFNSIEQVMNSQNSDFNAGYEPSVSVSVSLFSIIMIFICLLVLLFIYFSGMIRQGGKK